MDSVLAGETCYNIAQVDQVIRKRTACEKRQTLCQKTCRVFDKLLESMFELQAGPKLQDVYA